MALWSDPRRDQLTKFRIRVGAEEIALPVGVTLVGRDPSSRIAVFDTLVSRRHARIQCDHERAIIEDLGSRNGTRVNGVLIATPHELRPGDRVGIGAFELVVSLVEQSAVDLSDVPTGLLCICSACQNGYPAALLACPTCGARKPVGAPAAPRNDDTVRGRWSLGMLVELLGKAILAGRISEAERLMREAANIVNDRTADKKPIDPDELRALREAVESLSKAQKSRVWRDWMVGIDAQLTGRH